MKDYSRMSIDPEDSLFQIAWLELKLRRSPLIALISIYIPALMIVMASWLAFLLPDSETAAKLGIGITSLLSLITLTSYADSKLPKVSYFRGHDLFFGFSFAMMFSSCVVHVRRKFTILPRSSMLDQSKVSEMNCKLRIRSFSTVSVFVFSLLVFNIVYWPVVISMSQYASD
ncbi:hypothetical protein QYM36_008029 [Artemia franciscana]|uniref:Neurotransmitter-gated ion-channel transmembrane domain-containing protein n=2 Tax=Artemia franciscana TaxID=6661 RepID=A0AA88LM37_ARTSF|nr:hypothetical protein QYM36_008029 [Artemia franciscana]